MYSGEPNKIEAAASADLPADRAAALAASLSDDFGTLLHLTVQLTTSQAGKAIPAGQIWMRDAQVLARRLYYQFVSLHRLAQPVEVEVAGEVSRHIDHGSVLILTRAALETFLTFAHVYGCKDPGLRLFRHLVWHCAGLLDRQKNKPNASKPENLQKLADEAAAIATLRAQMASHDQWDQHPQWQRDKFLNGEWRGGRSWVALGEAAGFHPVFMKGFYSYLCGYAHASWLSVLQLRDARTVDQQAHMAERSVSSALVLMAFFVHHYVALFPEAASVLEGEPQAAALAKGWHLTAERMAPRYPEA